MQVAPEIADLLRLAERKKVPMPRALERAGVAHSTYLRWKDGSEPLAKTIRKVRAAIEELAQAR